jgi:hypothetical protein
LLGVHNPKQIFLGDALKLLVQLFALGGFLLIKPLFCLRLWSGISIDFDTCGKAYLDSALMQRVLDENE